MKTMSFRRLSVTAMLGVGSSIAPMVLIVFGLVQYKIIHIAGYGQVTTLYGITAGIASLALVLLNPLGGHIGDRTRLAFGRRRFWILTGSLLGFASMLLFSASTSMLTLTLSWIGLQFFYSMVATACYSLIPEHAEERFFGRISGMVGAATPAFVMVGSIVVMGKLSAIPVQHKIMLIAVLQLGCGLLTTLLVKELPSGAPTASYGGETVVVDKRHFYPSFRRYPSYTWALLTKLFINFTNAGVSLLTLFYIARFHLNEQDVFQLNALTSLGIIMMVGAGLAGGWLSDRIRRQKIFVIGAALLTGLCMLCFALSHSIWFAVVSNFIFNFGFGVYNAVENAIVNRILPSKESYAKDLAIINVSAQLSSSLVTFVSPLIISLGATLLGDDGYTLFFILLALFSLLSALCVIPIPEMDRQAAPAKSAGTDESISAALHGPVRQ